MAGADLANLVNEAALAAARQDRDMVIMEDFEMAKDKIMMGMERKSMIISEQEKRSTAYHESGHVLVSKLIPGSDPVHKVTIIPRGRALGLTSYLPIDERHNYSKDYLEILLCHLLGGRVAEKLVMNQLTTGAGNDIERATDLARKMVCEWGMSENLGPVTFGKKEEEIFLGREIAQHRDFSETTAQEIDKEVRKIITQAEKKVEGLLSQNMELLHRLAGALLEREILDGEEIDLLIAGKSLPRRVSVVKSGEIPGDGDKEAGKAKGKGKTARKKSSKVQDGNGKQKRPAGKSRTRVPVEKRPAGTHPEKKPDEKPKK